MNNQDSNTQPGDGAPKYQVTYRAILARLKSDHYPVGSRLPTEGELAHQYEVSRVTVRRALEMLVRDGYVKSRQGSGYTVLTLSPASETCLTSFTDAMLRAGREPSSHLMSIKTFPAGAKETAFLLDDMGELPVTVVSRLRLVDGEPHMLVKTYVPAAFMNSATPRDFPETGSNQSILRILSARFNLEWTSACEDICPVLADIDMARMLNAKPGQPLLKHVCTAFDAQGHVVFHEEVFRTGSVSFYLSQTSRVLNHTL